MKSVWRFLKKKIKLKLKLKIEFPYDPVIPLLGVYPKNQNQLTNEILVHQYLPQYYPQAK
jgi:hypothetical protein